MLFPIRTLWFTLFIHWEYAPSVEGLLFWACVECVLTLWLNIYFLTASRVAIIFTICCFVYSLSGYCVNYCFLNPEMASSDCLFVRQTIRNPKLFNFLPDKTTESSKSSTLRGISCVILAWMKTLQQLFDFQNWKTVYITNHHSQTAYAILLDCSTYIE